MPEGYAAILVAAGRSSRFAGDKLWADLWGRPTWRWSLDTLLAAPELSRVAIAVPRDAVDRYAEGLRRIVSAAWLSRAGTFARTR